ncbi:MAG: TolB protein, partial [Bacteroidota bacterium]
WEPVPAADLMGYRVERATTPSGVYAPAHQGLVPESMWTDPAGAVGQWYRVVAVDTSGNESRPSTAVQARLATAGRP